MLTQDKGRHLCALVAEDTWLGSWGPVLCLVETLRLQGLLLPRAPRTAAQREDRDPFARTSLRMASGCMVPSTVACGRVEAACASCPGKDLLFRWPRPRTDVNLVSKVTRPVCPPPATPLCSGGADGDSRASDSAAQDAASPLSHRPALLSRTQLLLPRDGAASTPCCQLLPALASMPRSREAKPAGGLDLVRAPQAWAFTR